MSPYATDQAVGGLHADHAAQRGGLADRTTGVRAEGDRSEPGGHGGGRAAGGAPGHPRRIPWVAGRPERRVLGRGTHGELVQVGLADGHRAGRRHPLAPRWRRRAGASLRGCGSNRSSGTPARAQVVLEGDGHAGERPGIVSGGHGGVDGAEPPARASSANTRLKAWISPLPGVDGGQMVLEHVDGGHLPGPDGGGDGDGGDGQVAAHGSSPRMAGTRKRSDLDRRGLGQHLGAIEARTHDVGAKHVHQRQRMGGGRHVVEVERLHVGGMVEHLRRAAR